MSIKNLFKSTEGPMEMEAFAEKIEGYPMKIFLLTIAQTLGWICCLAMIWMAHYIYLAKDDPVGGIFYLLLGILFTLILIHLFLLRLYEEQHKTRQMEAMLRVYKEKDTQAIQKRD